jgi:hypothetical protein
LDNPAVAVGVVEEDEGVPISARPINQGRAFVVLDWADLYASLEQLRPGSFDVGYDKLQALQ